MLVRETAVYFLARGIPAAINFFALAYFTRALAPDEYGIYAIVMAWVAVGNAVLFQWVRLAMLRALPASADPRGLLSTVLTTHVGIIAVVMAIGLSLAILAPHAELQFQLVVGTWLICALGWFELNAERSRAELRAGRYAALSAVKATGGFALGAFLVSLGWGGLGVLAGVAAASAVAPLLVRVGTWRSAGTHRMDGPQLVRLARYGVPLSVSLVLMFVVGAFDRVLIGWLLSTEAVGLYAAGYDLAQQTIGVVMGVVNLAGMPRIVKTLDEAGVAAARDQARRYGILLLHVALPIAVFFVILSENLSTQILGVHFSGSAARIIPLIALAALFGGLKAYYLDFAFQLKQQTYPQIGIAACIAFGSVALNLVLIPTLGISGAALSSLVAFSLGAMLSGLVGRRYFKMPLVDPEFGKAAVAALVMATVLWHVRHGAGWAALGWQILVAASSYAAACLLLNCVGIRNGLRASSTS